MSGSSWRWYVAMCIVVPVIIVLMSMRTLGSIFIVIGKSLQVGDKKSPVFLRKFTGWVNK